MKSGWRFLVYAESFATNIIKGHSILVGAVVRSLNEVESVRASLISLYGLDATEKALNIYKKLDRKDVNLIIISGVIIALYNIFDLHSIYEETGKPLIALSYRESKGIEDILGSLPEADKRIEIYTRNGERVRIRLKNNHTLYIRPIGLTTREALRILNKITIHGKIPEPVKVTKSIAKGFLMSITSMCETLSGVKEGERHEL